MLQEILKARNLLPLESRETMLRLLEEHSYGKLPDLPLTVSGTAETVPHDLEDPAITRQILRITLQKENGEYFTYPLELYIPGHVAKPPVLMHLHMNGNHGDSRVDMRREILGRGFSLVRLSNEDVMPDSRNGNYETMLGAFLGMHNDRGPEDTGKIGLWAFACSRALDYLLTLPDIDAAHTFLLGHSRLGKTVLWAGARDERFFGILDNASGYGGAATSRHGACPFGGGERVVDFIRAGSWDWFCENFKKYTEDLEEAKPYDQAFLLALLAPRFYCMGTADDDPGADADSMYLTALHASSAWEARGAKGLVAPDRMPHPGDVFHEGNIGFHQREGKHELNREDWEHYLDFMTEKLTRNDP
ncbi:MAG: hypothetical protein HUJ69_09390 [Lachnospiraceae bacterium]|nr:hypothetical protein [Lachnospiraceae bacterium]